ncbi:MAG: PTS sugar transporter subunit IIA [Chitinivibrionales bacterium]|nr:PTS sugar transporter subunit IIA [Chitinivibrionales bacterium]
MKLSSLLNRNLIFLDKDFSDYPEIIDFVSEKLSASVDVPAFKIKETFLRRENIGSTFIGHRLAMPHGYLDTVNTISIVFIRLRETKPVRIEAHNEMVRYIFAILTSKQKAELYLKVLRQIANTVKNHSYILDQALTADHLITALDQKEIMVDETFTAGDMISLNVKVNEDATVSEALEVMRKSNISFIPVVSKTNALLGVIDLADLFLATFPNNDIHQIDFTTAEYTETTKGFFLTPLKHFWDNEEHRSVKEVMRKCDNHCINYRAEYRQIVFLMAKYHYRYLVVLDDFFHVLGIIDTNDIIHKMIRA